MTHRGDRRARRRGRGAAAGSPPASAARATARRSSSRRRRATRPSRSAIGRVRRGRGSAAGLPPWPVGPSAAAVETMTPSDEDEAPSDPARLARRLPVRGAAGARRLDRRRRCAAVYAIVCKPDPTTAEQYAVIYVGHVRRPVARSASRSTTRGPAAGCKRAGNRCKLSICTYEVPGGLALAPRADRPRARRDLPPELQHRAVRPRVEGRVDRRVPRAHRRPAHDRRATRAPPRLRAGSRPLRGAASGGCPRPAWPAGARRGAPVPRRWRRRRCPRPCRRAAAARRR